MTINEQSRHRFLINIADFVVALETDDQAVVGRLYSHYQEFLSPTEPPLITVTLKVTPGALFITPEPGAWIIQASYEANRLVYCSYQEQGEVDLVAGRGVLEMAPEAQVENFLRVLYAWLCLKNQALLLHAAGVIRDGQGYVFFGPSGAGKTTTSRLAARAAHVVSDDLVIIRAGEEGCTLYGVPFRGEFSDAPRANLQAPLRGLFRLKQDVSHYLKPIPHVKGVADLVAASPFVVRELSLSGTLLSVCNQIARLVPVQELHFKRDDGFWKVIHGDMAEIPQAASSDGRSGYRR
ncbi:MAG: hypothetical protein L0332_31405 [Chloroflexi bacterium]|nr:hypothetical protein [Chloroflexota bacterium]MCI0576326.1 hypothetical protein [Chloroflexota bacterium]MCI0650125.1 hypothetical protein [Chloroflexota bacterium]MCI0731209.1 hypothetical protein [Chloroflexota bacterium]